MAGNDWVTSLVTSSLPFFFPDTTGRGFIGKFSGKALCNASVSDNNVLELRLPVLLLGNSLYLALMHITLTLL